MVKESLESPKETFLVNNIGLINFLDVLRTIKLQFLSKVIIFTSDKVYENNELRKKLNEKCLLIKEKLLQSNIPFVKTKSHIIPIIIGDPILCKKAADELFDNHKVYLQPINFPTVPRGQERLRITPTPLHTDKMIDELIYALKQTWKKLKLKHAA